MRNAGNTPIPEKALHRLEEMLENKVVTESDCWLIQPDVPGYPRVHARLGHRVSFTKFVRELQRGEVVMHLCDNKQCVNPQHLVAGSQRENIQQSIASGLFVHPRGEQHGSAVLTEDAVREIRQRHSAGEKTKHLATEFGVGNTTVYSIVTRARWKHVV